METNTSVDRVGDDGFALENDTLDGDGSTTSRENDSEDSSGQQGSNSKKRRIVYNKEFLLECFFLPRSRQKPVDFPLPNLGCTLGSIKSVGTSPFTAPPPYVPPTKRKEENGRRERERDPDDNISLRPHSGNFSGGCGPNLPVGPREREGMNVGLQQIIDDFRDNHQRTTNLRFANNKRFELVGDRNRVERDRSERERDILDRGPRERDRDRGERERDNRDRGERDPPRGERDRDRGERERDRGVIRERDRDLRDRNARNGETNHFNNHRRPPHTHGSWGVDVPERETDWNRRRNRNGSGGTRDPKEKGNYYERRGHYRDREREEEQEPEWFSGGPSSQHETIELRGFTDDERRDKFKPKDTPYGRDNSSRPTMNGSANGSSGPSKAMEQVNQREAEETGAMDFSLEKILKMDHIPGILPNGLLEDEEPSGMSKFSQIFQRNSANNVPKDDSNGKQLLHTLIDTRAATTNSGNLNEETEHKKEIVEELGNALRSILLKPSQPKTEKVEQRKHVEKKNMLLDPPQHHHNINAQTHSQPIKTEKQSTGVNMLQALLEKMIEPGSKTASGRSSVEVGEPIGFGPPPGLRAPESKQSTSVLTQIINAGMPNNSGPLRPPQQFFPPKEHPEMGRPFNPQTDEEKWNILTMPQPQVQQASQPMQVNPFQIFESLIKQQHPPNTPRDIMNPHQVMTMLPPEIQFLISHVDVNEEFWSQPDCRPLIGALTTGDFSFRKLINDLVSPACNRKPFLASMVQMILSGIMIVPSLTIVGQPLKFIKPQESHPSHQMQNRQNSHEMSTRQQEDNGRDMMRRSGTPVSSMAFGMTPTSVMRKMTAEPSLPKPIGSPASNNLGSNGPPPRNTTSQADFSFLVSQLTGQNSARPQQPMIHPIHFPPMHPHGPILLPQQGPGMMMHPNFVGMVPPQQVMNIPHPHHEMPQS